MKEYPIRYCTGGCTDPEHHAHVYDVDPVDGPLSNPRLCPGNLGEAKEILEDGEPLNVGFVEEWTDNDERALRSRGFADDQ